MRPARRALLQIIDADIACSCGPATRAVWLTRPAQEIMKAKDRSAADFNFCLISIDRGWSVEGTANQLMAESEKAKSVGYNYTLFTAKRAASVVSSNRR